ncbi:hypothetical protein ANOM_007895 [Aspergillus nomiae NRRL 13137]|uniref:Uncharacterized protein n=1 Tax=Aspergillus nomiae NRRL (strain ATCC 15546 / NRRL 13137 / CBS 260.88 / M93) TaxID=1509407 RepID=A0A0L1IYV5_ASPN3|nr:uncharacterized protein ANOM_007895 [Aspergillus nomiae NRRL 13137]KNG84580.1 hypothetical protein ANOM_007895 [Aspergillus nomiae NRRL 13137]
MWWMLLFKAFKIGNKAYKTHKNKNGHDDALNPNSINLSGPPPPPPAPLKTRLKAHSQLLLHFLELVFGLTVVGLYGRDVRAAHKNGDAQNAKWVYALVTGALGAGTGLVYLGYGVVMVKLDKLGRERRMVGSLGRLAWGFVLVVLWLVVFGVFGGMYIGVHGEGSEEEVEKTKRMRHAVWVDLVNLVFWVGGMVIEGLRWWRLRGGRGVGGGLETGEKEVAPA